MKVKLTHVLIALLAIIIIFNLGKNVVEGMENKHKHGGNHKGIKKGNVPEGDEDLYILKSQIVPPVCPACPSNSTCPRTEAPPPCPPCARCPEPAFECKKVPNYRANDDSYLPRPVLSDFSQFGM